MKKGAIKPGPFLIHTLCGIAVAAVISSGYLYSENSSYQAENRRLIIQNDSILSANIELKKAAGHKASLSAATPFHNGFRKNESK